MKRRLAGRVVFLTLLVVFGGGLGVLGAELEEGVSSEKETAPVERKGRRGQARFKVSGYGMFGNRELKRLVEVMQAGRTKPEVYDAQFIEDAALILASRLTQDGFLNPVLRADVVLADGSTVQYEWDDPVEQPLPRPLDARSVHFRIEEGLLYYYAGLEFEGLETLTEKEARSFFVETGTLLPIRRNRIYTPENVERGLSSIVETLERRGYQSAQAEITEVERDDKTGAMRVRVEVKEGLKSVVRTVRERLYEGGVAEPIELGQAHLDQPYSQVWLQDLVQSLKKVYFQKGYPDTTVDVTTERQREIGGQIDLELLATIRTGKKIRANQVRFEGQKKTKLSVLDRRVGQNSGELLDRLEAEKGRFRLARLGVFDSVELAYEPVGDEARDVVYRVREGKQIDVNLLFGYGSYELLRGGVEVEQFNIFGRAHHSRLRLVQSFKSSSADYNYTMPELVGEDLDVFLHASGLRREEISFVRQEYGGGAGARKFFDPIHTELSGRYSFQVLSAAETDPGFRLEGVEEASVGAFILDVRHDRRDNPLYPKQGYKVFGNIELASEYLAGDVNYQRIELAGSYHIPIDAGRAVHLGLSHGAVLSEGSAMENLPLNRRFFPGGENSVRGFQQGEAAPRNARGRVVGAETYIGGSVEFEQALTRIWSLVGFVDGVGFARRIEDYPLDETLFSAGLGIRWKTIIGPVRLEYGHNLNPREDDPAGTLHFSIGFPF